MLDEILSDEQLFAITRTSCNENEIFVEISNNISEDDFLVLKIDQYYNSLNIRTRHPSVDCLIIVRCQKNEGYDLYLVELKNIKRLKGFKTKNIEEKFKTALEDFMSDRFSHIFLNDNYRINKLRMYFISDPLGLKKKYPNITAEQYRRRFSGTKLDMLQSSRPVKFRNKITNIDPRLPNPMAKPC